MTYFINDITNLKHKNVFITIILKIFEIEFSNGMRVPYGNDDLVTYTHECTVKLNVHGSLSIDYMNLKK